MDPRVRREDHDDWTTLWLNRPEKLNALTTEFFAELRSHVEALQDDDSIRCVVLRGAGRCFSAGHDLNDISAGESSPSAGWHSQTLRLLEKLPKPVIAAVHGHCYTGALEVALACDFIVAADNARFGDTHAKWALTPIWGLSQRLPRRVGAAAAKRLMFTCDMIDAAESVRIGLAEYAIPYGDFDQEITTLATRIAANSPFSHRANKQLLEATDAISIDAGLHWEVLENAGVGPDMQDRIATFTARTKDTPTNAS
ncbi:enoyl-CoA hydratase/isomerase family protein [Mycobacterium sp.]|uniref:enoyl-CoA hydratase/isomerase family protein n=1 Tax=Mycobacterium sp. TaxID=1785 RepID=UPI003D6A9A11